MEHRKNLEEALREGLRRAAVHIKRAGKEVITGAGAFLDEVIRVKREARGRLDSDDAGPTRIDVE